MDVTAAIPTSSTPRAWLRPMIEFVLVTLAVAALLVGLGALLHGGTIHMLLVLLSLGLCCCATCFAIVEFVVHAVRGEFKTRSRRPLLLLAVAATLVVVTMLSVLVGTWFEHRYLQSARAWCVAQVPAIEAYRNDHGSYPTSFQQIAKTSPAPWTAREFEWEYHGGGEEYSLTLYTGPISGWSWFSGRRGWEYFN